jgi:NitT/TauT family transport system substrate-binding protein
MTIYKKTVGETRTLRWNISPEVYNEEIDHHLKLGVLKSAPLFNDAMTNELLTEVQAMDFKAFIKNEVDRVFPLGMTFADWKNKVMELKA